MPSEEDMLRSVFLEDWPLVAVASDAVPERVEADSPRGGSPPPGLSVSCVRLYSLRRQSYVHSLTLPGMHRSPSCLGNPRPIAELGEGLGVLWNSLRAQGGGEGGNVVAYGMAGEW